MSDILDFTVQLVRKQCPSCGINFAIPTFYDEKLRETGNRCYCPNGHGLGYVDRSVDRKDKPANQHSQGEKGLLSFFKKPSS